MDLPKSAVSPVSGNKLLPQFSVDHVVTDRNESQIKSSSSKVYKRFNSINETGLNAAEQQALNNHSSQALDSSSSAVKNPFKTGFKQRLSLKIIKKRDSLMSKLEEDKKFLNSIGEPVELEVILPDRNNRLSASFRDDAPQEESEHFLGSSSAHEKHTNSSNYYTRKQKSLKNHLAYADTIDINAEEEDTYEETVLNKSQQLQKQDTKTSSVYNSPRFKKDLKRSTNLFDNIINMNKRSNLGLPSTQDEDTTTEDSEFPPSPREPSLTLNLSAHPKDSSNDCLKESCLDNTSPSSSNHQQQQAQPQSSSRHSLSPHLTNSSSPAAMHSSSLKIRTSQHRISATASSIPSSPQPAVFNDLDSQPRNNFLSKSYDGMNAQNHCQNLTSVHINHPSKSYDPLSTLGQPENMQRAKAKHPQYQTVPNIYFPNPNHTGQNSSNNNEYLYNENEPKAAAYSYLKYYFVSMLQPSDNKLAMKLFGSKKGVLKEKLRQQKVGHWIIHPCSNFRFYWDLVMLILLIANVIILPIAISFLYENMSHTGLLIFNLVSDSMFLLDILVNFRTGVLQNDYVDEIILEPRMIAKHYFRTWFFVDFLSSIPLDYLFLLVRESGENFQLARTGRALKVLRLVKLLSLLRLLRLSRLVRYIHQWEEFLSIASMVMRILNLVCLIILLAHWNGCLQFLVPMLQSFPKDSWVCLNNLQNADWTEQYTVALFKALSHMLCIGYGRYPPQTYTDMWLTMLSMVTGAMCYAVTIGHVSALVQSFDTSRRMYNDKFKQVEEYMVWRKFPRDMRTRITEYYEHRYQGKMFDEDNILKELSERLRLDIINYNCRSLVSSVPFFANADNNFVSDVVTKLHFEVFQPGDLIIREGTIGNKMYFIQEGIVDVIKTNNEVMTTLSDGSYFGEICLLTKARRVASVQAVTYCNLYSLSVEHFNTVLEQYPMMRRTLESVAAERLNKLGKNPNIISSRVDLKSDRETLKDIVAKSSPANSSRCSSEGGASPQLKQSKSFIFQTTNLIGNLKRNNSASELDAINSTENAKFTSPTSSSKQSKLKSLKDNLHIHLPHIKSLTKSSNKILVNKTSSGANSPENTANNNP